MEPDVEPVAEDAEGIVAERKKGSADEHIGHRKSATSKPAGTSIGESAYLTVFSAVFLGAVS